MTSTRLRISYCINVACITLCSYPSSILSFSPLEIFHSRLYLSSLWFLILLIQFLTIFLHNWVYLTLISHISPLFSLMFALYWISICLGTLHRSLAAHYTLWARMARYDWRTPNGTCALGPFRYIQPGTHVFFFVASIKEVCKQLLDVHYSTLLSIINVIDGLTSFHALDLHDAIYCAAQAMAITHSMIELGCSKLQTKEFLLRMCALHELSERQRQDLLAHLMSRWVTDTSIYKERQRNTTHLTLKLLIVLSGQIVITRFLVITVPFSIDHCNYFLFLLFPFIFLLFPFSFFISPCMNGADYTEPAIVHFIQTRRGKTKNKDKNE